MLVREVSLPFHVVLVQTGERAFRDCRNRTVSSVFWISGILALRPSARRSVLACMNWYLLSQDPSQPGGDLHFEGGDDARDHLLEALEHALDVGAGGDVVLDAVDEGRERDAARVGRGIFASAREGQQGSGRK